MSIFEILVLDKAGYCSPTGDASSFFFVSRIKILADSFGAGEERIRRGLSNGGEESGT